MYLLNNIRKHIPFNVKLSLITLFSFILLFTVWRLLFLYFYINDFNSEWSLYLKSFYIGYRLDAVLASFLTLPVLFLFQFSQIKFKDAVKKLYHYYIILLCVIISFLNVINIEFFKEFGMHLNIQAQMYGFESGAETWIQVWYAYPVFLYLFIIIAVTYFINKVNKLIINRLTNVAPALLPKIILSFMLFLFIIISARGGLQQRPVSTGHAYFSKADDMANHLAMNTIYSYIRSLIQNSKEPLIKYYENADEITQQIINNNRSINNNRPDKSYNRPNIIMIVLESHTGARCNFLNEKLTDNITPNLDKLAHSGINFINCYANGPRTAHGLGSILCSWPTIPGYPLIRQPQYKIKGQSTFASIFKNMGYETGFIYGGDAEFDEMKSFTLVNDFDKIYDHSEDPYLSQFKLDNKYGGSNPWGVFDEFLFNRCINIMNEKNNDQPIMLTLLTTTNHAPWIIPENHNNKITIFNENTDIAFSKSRRTMRYVDFALGNFFEQAKEHTDWFENTIFIITADHGLNIFKDKINDPRNGHIPFIIYNSQLESMEIDKLVSHIDILPTILDLIGEYDTFDETLFGSSGFAGDKGFVFRNNDYNIQYIENGWVYSEMIETNFQDYYRLYQSDATNLINKELFQKNCRAYLQSAFYGQKELIQKGINNLNP